MGFQELIDQYRAGNVAGEQPLPALKGGYLDSGTPAPTPATPPPAETRPVPTISSAPTGAMEKAQSADIRSPNALGEMFASFVNNLEGAKQNVVKAAVESKPAQQVGLLGQAAKTAYSTLPQPVQAAGNVVGQGVGLLGDALSYQPAGMENAVGGPGILEAITPMASKAASAVKAVGSLANMNRAQAVSAARDIAVKAGARNVSGVQHIEKYFRSVGDDVTANVMRMLQEDMAAGKVSLTATEAATAGAARPIQATARPTAPAAEPAPPSMTSPNREEAVNAAINLANRMAVRSSGGVYGIEKYFAGIGDFDRANAMRMLQEEMEAGRVAFVGKRARSEAPALAVVKPTPATVKPSAPAAEPVPPPVEPVPPPMEPPLTPVKGAEAFAGEAKPAFDALSMSDDVVKGTAFASVPRASRAGIYNATMKEVNAGTKVVMGGEEFVATAEGTRGSIRFVDSAGKAVDNATNVKLVGYAGGDFASVAGRNPGKTIYKVSYKTNSGGDSYMWTTWEEAQPIVSAGRGKMVRSVRVPSEPVPSGAGATTATGAGTQRVQGSVGATRPVPPPTPEAVAAEAAAQNAPVGLSRAKEWFNNRSKLQKGLLGTAGAGAGAAAMSPFAGGLSEIGADARLRSKDPSLTPVQQWSIGGFSNVMSGAGAVSSLAGSGARTIVDLFTKPAGEIQKALQENPELAQQIQAETGLDTASPAGKATLTKLAEQGAETPEGQQKAMDVAVSDLTNMVVDGKDDDEIDKYMGNTFVGTLSKLIFGDTKKWWLFMALGMGIGAAAGANGRRDVIDRIMGAFYAAPMAGLKEIRQSQKDPKGDMYILTDSKGNNKIVRDTDFDKFFKNGVPNDIKIRRLGAERSSRDILTERGQILNQMKGAIDESDSALKFRRMELSEAIADSQLISSAFVQQNEGNAKAIIAQLRKTTGKNREAAFNLADWIEGAWLPDYTRESKRREMLYDRYRRFESGGVSSFQ